jgi:hypothetical protein
MKTIPKTRKGKPAPSNNTELEQQTVSYLAQKIRTYFITKKTVLSGNIYKPVARMDSDEIWEKAGKKCYQMGMSPDDFVEMAFSQNTRGVHGLFPTHLGSTVMDLFYRNYKSQSVYAGNVQAPAFKRDNKKEVIAKIEEDISSCMDHLIVWFNTIDYTQEEMLEYLRSPFCQFPAYIKIILGYPDIEVMENESKEAWESKFHSATVQEALKDMGYPSDLIRFG